MFYIYTDGACSVNKRNAGCRGGYGFLIIDESEKVICDGGGFETNATNNRMELTAAIKGVGRLIEYLNWINKNPSDSKVIIVTDSKYLSDNFVEYLPVWKQNNWRKSNGKKVLNDDLWKELDRVTSALGEFLFEWVKGHSGNIFNDKVDDIATAHAMTNL